MKWSLYNNPFTWVFALILLMLTCNLLTKKTFVNKFPDNIIIEPMTTSLADLVQLDSILVSATDHYEAGIFKQWVQGSNYRAAWNTSIKVPVVLLDTVFGGLKPIKKGGGNQTRSMDLTDTLGVYYSIRSITKNPINLVPNWAWKIGIENIVTDGTSAGHPYAALVIPPLAEAVEVLHTHPRLIYLPAQSRLDSFNQLFGNRLFLLEYEPKGVNTSWTGLENVIEIIDTKDVREKMEKDTSLKIDQHALVRARLLDIVVGDWDRHAKQWEWAVCKKDSQIIFRPIPTDRDNAFYGISGVIPWLINRPVFEERLRPFQKDVDYFPGLIANAKYFDSFFLLNVSKSIFLAEALKMQKALTDEIIEKAIMTWPKALYDLDGAEIIDKLKSRRDKLPEYGEKFYTILQENGFIPKPAEPEIKVDLKE